MEDLDKLLDACTYELEIFSSYYKMMGQMLDRKYIKSRAEIMGLLDIYIYGGGYLGIQLYDAISPYVNVLSIVDRSGKMLIEVPDIPVVALDEFKSVYKGQNVIITPVRHYKSIYMELSGFIPKNRMIFLGEFLGGIL